MRIISGECKGRRLYPGKNFKARPTTDFAKENLFNVLSNYFDFKELSVLDLFSGTGSIAYEFSSRGSRPVASVEINPAYHSFIRNTAIQLGFKDLKAFRADAFRFIRHAHHEYNIIFADPPFDLKEAVHLPDLIFIHKLLKPCGWFILEHGREHDYSSHPRFMELRKYGSVHFSIFEETIEEKPSE